MAHYLLGVDLTDKPCVVIGGGTIAERKVDSFLDFDAAVTVVAPDLTPRLRELASEGKITHRASVYESDALNGAFLVVAATGDRSINAGVSADARARGIPANVVDEPDLCTFFVPATVRRGDLVIGVSTSGKSPAMARRVREQLDARFGPEYGELADLLGELRDEVKSHYPDTADRNRAYLRILDSDVLELLAQGRREEARKKAQECIS